MQPQKKGPQIRADFRRNAALEAPVSYAAMPEGFFSPPTPRQIAKTRQCQIEEFQHRNCEKAPLQFEEPSRRISDIDIYKAFRHRQNAPPPPAPERRGHSMTRTDRAPSGFPSKRGSFVSIRFLPRRFRAAKVHIKPPHRLIMRRSFSSSV